MKNKVINLINNNKRWILFFISIMIFIFLLYNVVNNKIANFDTAIFEIIKSMRTYININLFKSITLLGSAPALIVITILASLLIRNKKIAVMITLNLLIIGGLNQLLKNIIQRPRPIESRLIQANGYSFPSGHSMASMAFYGLMIYLINKYVKNKKIKITCSILLSILILLIGISRIYLGIHYTSDVIAGFTISIAYLTIFTAIVCEK